MMNSAIQLHTCELYANGTLIVEQDLTSSIQNGVLQLFITISWVRASEMLQLTIEDHAFMPVLMRPAEERVIFPAKDWEFSW